MDTQALYHVQKVIYHTCELFRIYPCLFIEIG